jgi:D-3-phosphoglycerate dehydrogenase
MTESLPKVLVADEIAIEGVNQLRTAAAVDFLPEITPTELLLVIEKYDALVVRSRTKVTPEVVTAGKNLKVVGRAGVGVDNINLPACRTQGITVVNSPLAASVAVAELTLGLLLAVCRQLPVLDADMKNGGWPKKKAKGIELYGKTLGLIALGRIALEVASRAKAFGMNVIAYDPFLDAASISERGATAVSLQQLFATSDFISIHTPLTQQTRSMINAASLASMKPGVVLVCAARGGVIDEAALLAALESGQVAGAGLDVFETEPPGATALVKHPRVICTPHIGAQTEEAQNRAGEDIAAEVVRALTGQTLRWQVP